MFEKMSLEICRFEKMSFGEKLLSPLDFSLTPGGARWEPLHKGQLGTLSKVTCKDN